jgi:hypothetical protein
MPEPAAPLSDEQLAAIRLRHERSRHSGEWRTVGQGDATADRGQLLAEVDRLRVALAAAEALAGKYGARIVAASMAAAPRDTPEAGR